MSAASWALPDSGSSHRAFCAHGQQMNQMDALGAGIPLLGGVYGGQPDDVAMPDHQVHRLRQILQVSRQVSIERPRAVDTPWADHRYAGRHLCGWEHRRHPDIHLMPGFRQPATQRHVQRRLTRAIDTPRVAEHQNPLRRPPGLIPLDFIGVGQLGHRPAAGHADRRGVPGIDRTAVDQRFWRCPFCLPQPGNSLANAVEQSIAIVIGPTCAVFGDQIGGVLIADRRRNSPLVAEGFEPDRNPHPADRYRVRRFAGIVGRIRPIRHREFAQYPHRR